MTMCVNDELLLLFLRILTRQRAREYLNLDILKLFWFLPCISHKAKSWLLSSSFVNDDPISL
jgi:hypothetical protein